MLGNVIKRRIMLKPTQVQDFVNEATKCDFDVDTYYNRYVVDAKSILGLMSLAIPSGENVVIEATGDQADAAIADIASILGK